MNVRSWFVTAHLLARLSLNLIIQCYFGYGFGPKSFKKKYAACTTMSEINSRVCGNFLNVFRRRFLSDFYWSKTVQSESFRDFDSHAICSIIHVKNYGTFCYIPDVVLANFFNGARSAVWLTIHILGADLLRFSIRLLCNYRGVSLIILKYSGYISKELFGTHFMTFWLQNVCLASDLLILFFLKI